MRENAEEADEEDELAPGRPNPDKTKPPLVAGAVAEDGTAEEEAEENKVEEAADEEVEDEAEEEVPKAAKFKRPNDPPVAAGAEAAVVVAVAAVVVDAVGAAAELEAAAEEVLVEARLRPNRGIELVVGAGALTAVAGAAGGREKKVLAEVEELEADEEKEVCGSEGAPAPKV